MNNRIAEIEKIYTFKVPERLKKFYVEREFEKYKVLNLESGYLRGEFEVNFLDEDLLQLHALGDNQGISGLMEGGDYDGKWAKDYAGYIPFATLDDIHAKKPKKGEEPNLAKAFLVVDTKSEDCQVLLWDHEGALYPVAKSLDDFLAGFPAEWAEFRKHEHLSIRYDKFSWK